MKTVPFQTVTMNLNPKPLLTVVVDDGIAKAAIAGTALFGAVLVFGTFLF